MPTLFSRIVRNEIPAHKLLEDDKYCAFLDIRPINPGHTLIIPKKEIDYLFDLDDALLAGMMVFAKKIARAIKMAVPCQRIGVMVAGLEVPHAHIHLVPMGGEGDLTFARARSAKPEELAELAKKIREHLK